MPARRPQPPAAQPPSGEPPFYEALVDLYPPHDPGLRPVCAYRAGSRVSPSAVRKNGWRGKVKVPDQFAPPPVPPTTTAAPAGGEE